MLKTAIILLALIHSTLSMANQPYKADLKFYYDDNNYLNYKIVGSGPNTVILLHGFGASLNSWNDIAAKFPKDLYTLYLLDLKGFGFSSRPFDDKYSIDVQANLVINFIKSVGLYNVTIVGHSYGGAVGLTLAVDIMETAYANRLQKIVLIDAAAYTDQIPFFIKILRSKISNFISLNLISSTQRAKIILKRLFFDKTKIDAERIERYAYFFSLKDSDYSFTTSAKQIIPNKHLEYIKKYRLITTPTLIIWGENDPIFETSIAKKLNADISSSELKFIEYCGHIPQEETPVLTFNMINNFIMLQ